MSLIPTKYYKYHSENLKELKKSLNSLSAYCRIAIIKNDEIGISSHEKALLLICGAIVEVKSRKLLHEPNGFSDSERKTIENNSKSLEDTWVNIVNTAIIKRYNGDINNEKVIGKTAALRAKEIIFVIKNELSSVILLRNKIAHGQWYYPLKSYGDEVENNAMKMMRKENVLTMNLKMKVVDSISDIVTDLIVSRPAFERDFDHHYSRFQNLKDQIENKDYNNYVENLKNAAKSVKA